MLGTFLNWMLQTVFLESRVVDWLIDRSIDWCIFLYSFIGSVWFLCFRKQGWSFTVQKVPPCHRRWTESRGRNPECPSPVPEVPRMRPRWKMDWWTATPRTRTTGISVPWSFKERVWYAFFFFGQFFPHALHHVVSKWFYDVSFWWNAKGRFVSRFLVLLMAIVFSFWLL